MTHSVHPGQLAVAGLIQLASLQPELEYLFRLYAAPDRHPIRGGFFPLRAFHFAGGDATRAQHDHNLSGGAAAQAGASARDVIDLHTPLGRVHEFSGDFAAALATIAGRSASVVVALGPTALAAMFEGLADPLPRAGLLGQRAARALLTNAASFTGAGA